MDIDVDISYDGHDVVKHIKLPNHWLVFELVGDLHTLLKLDPHPHLARLSSYTVEDATRRSASATVSLRMPNYGQDLSRLLREDPPRSTRKRIFNALLRQIGAALAHLHLRGLVHGDVKPANICVSFHNAEPHLTLIDFGLAIHPRFKSTAQLYGVPFRPPEAFNKGKPNPKSDIYALGCTVYEVRYGTYYIHGAKVEPTDPYANVDDAYLQRFRDAKPPEELALLLAYDPDERFSAKQLIAAHAYIDDAPIARVCNTIYQWVDPERIHPQNRRLLDDILGDAVELLTRAPSEDELTQNIQSENTQGVAFTSAPASAPTSREWSWMVAIFWTLLVRDRNCHIPIDPAEILRDLGAEFDLGRFIRQQLRCIELCI